MYGLQPKKTRTLINLQAGYGQEWHACQRLWLTNKYKQHHEYQCMHILLMPRRCNDTSQRFLVKITTHDLETHSYDVQDHPPKADRPSLKLAEHASKSELLLVRVIWSAERSSGMASMCTSPCSKGPTNLSLESSHRVRIY